MSTFHQELRRRARAALSRLRERRVRLGAGLVVLALALALSLNLSGGSDDCYITFWSAFSLAQHGQLTNYNGDPGEQSSSLLHTVALAAIHFVTGLSLPAVAWAFGVAMLVLAGIRTNRLFRLFFPEGPEPPVWLPAVVCASGILSYNATNGLETTLAAYVYLEFSIQLIAFTREAAPGRRRLVKLGLITACLLMVRPEALIIFGLVILCAGAVRGLVGGRAAMRPFVAPLALLSAGSVVLLSLRYAIMGEWFPGPVLAKASGASGQRTTRILEGIQYLLEATGSAEGWLIVVALVTIAVIAYRERKQAGTASLIVFLVLYGQIGFVVFSGGDWMPAARFLAHAFPLVYLSFLVALQALRGSSEKSSLAGGWGFALGVVGIVGAYQIAATRGYARTLWNYRQVAPLLDQQLPGASKYDWTVKANLVHTRDIPTITAFKRLLSEVRKVVKKPEIVSSQAGMVSYYLARNQFGRFRFHDLKGLTSDRFLQVARVLEAGSSRSGLTLSYSDLFALSREVPKFKFEPDIIFDTKESRRDLVVKNGYVVVYEQSGTAANTFFSDSERCRKPEKHLAGTGAGDKARARAARTIEEESVSFFPRTFRLHQFIAIRKELAVRLGWLNPRESETATEVDPRFFERVRWEEQELLTQWKDGKPPFGCY